jgi:hypothetical protein
LSASLFLSIKRIKLDITPFIRELILLNECVILRGVGGFETSYKPATFNRRRKIILPPGKKLNFRSELIKDNGVLESYLIKNLEIDAAKASALIDEFVAWFFNTMKESGKVFLEGIGEFKFDKKNNIVFSGIENENYLAESFGLDSLVFENGANEEIPEENEPIPVVVKKRKLTGWYIAVGVLLLLISITTLILISTSNRVSIFQWSGKKSNSENKDKVIFGNTNKALEDSIIMAIEKSLNENTIPKTALAVPQTKDRPEEITVTHTGKYYYLVAGSFRSRKNAEILKLQLENKGFNPEFMVAGENYFRVIIGAYSDRRKAIDELRRLRSQIDQSIWLLEENNVN